MTPTSPDEHPVVRQMNEGSKENDLWGAKCGSVKEGPGVELTEPTGEVWDAEDEGAE